MKELMINKKIINIYCGKNDKEELPVIMINMFQNETKELWEKCIESNISDFILVSISNINWNDDLTPWKCNPIYKGDLGYKGDADNYLKELEELIIPKVKEYVTLKLNKKITYYGIIGYSLAGLFALYTAYKTNTFKRIGSVSGSLWYPDFSDYIKKNKISENVDKIYFSLGNKEKNTKIELLSTVEDKTKEIYEYVSKNINSIYEENEGNHFNDEILRIFKGIKWILENEK